MSAGKVYDRPSPFAGKLGHFSVHHFGGDHWHFKFANGFGASVVRFAQSYGGDRGLWELGVLGVDGHLTYDTPITDDVIGWLSEAAVADLLGQIEALDGAS